MKFLVVVTPPSIYHRLLCSIQSNPIWLLYLPYSDLSTPLLGTSKFSLVCTRRQNVWVISTYIVSITILLCQLIASSARHFGSHKNSKIWKIHISKISSTCKTMDIFFWLQLVWYILFYLYLHERTIYCFAYFTNILSMMPMTRSTSLLPVAPIYPFYYVSPLQLMTPSL